LGLGTKKPFETSNNLLNKASNDRNVLRGAKNISSTMKFEKEDINEAKESLKLLKQKINTNNTMNKFSGLSNTLSGLNPNNNNINIPNTSHNYRKAFKPNLNNNDINLETANKLHSQTLKQNNNNNFPSKDGYASNNNNKGYSSNTSQGNKFSYNSAKPNIESRINKNSINPVFSQPPMKKGEARFKIEEVDDDRPAFAQGQSNEPEVDEVGNLQECHGCGRKFREEALLKHAKACKKVFQSKRKPFDMEKKRILDSEHAMILKQAKIEEKTNPKLKQVKLRKKENWKKQSEMLRNVAAANKTGADFMKKNSGNVLHIGKNQGGNTYNNDNLTPCNTCGRRYNENAYNKHLSHCERKDRENKMKGKSIGNSKNNHYQPTSNNSRPNLNNKFGKK